MSAEINAAGISDFVERHSQEIKVVGGIGLLAGSALVLHRAGALSKLSTLLNPERAAGEVLGVSKDVLARLKDVDHFVFDMDRTLVDHDKSLNVLIGTMKDQLVRYTNLDREFISNAIDETTERLDSPYFYNRLDQILPLQERFRGVNLNERFGEVSQAAREAYHSALKADPEVVQLLDYLKSQGKQVHIFTASTTNRALEKLQGAGILHKIDRVYASGKNGFEDYMDSGLASPESTGANIITLPGESKPEGFGYPWIIQDLNTVASKTAMTGDHPWEDVRNAKEAGMLTAKANWFRNKEAEVLPDLELFTPSQLTQIVQAAQARA